MIQPHTLDGVSSVRKSGFRRRFP